MTRQAQIIRKTNETSIEAKIVVDGAGIANINSGIGFLDHMLEQLARHSMMNITLKAQGDLNIDAHHTTEDTGWTLGSALHDALGDKAGINRYGCATIPMDECLSRASIDLSGRPFLVWGVKMPTQKLGNMDTELFQEWFQAFAMAANITLHVETIYGTNTHHIIESCYKALARSLKEACAIDPMLKGQIPSTKGTLGN